MSGIAKATFQAVHFEKGIVNGCAGCKKVLTTGTWAVGLTVHEDGRDFKYLVGYDPKLECCGTEKTAVRTFDSPEAAESAIPELRAITERDGSTMNLPLLEMHWLASKQSH